MTLIKLLEGSSSWRSKFGEAKNQDKTCTEKNATEKPDVFRPPLEHMTADQEPSTHTLPVLCAEVRAGCSTSELLFASEARSGAVLKDERCRLEDERLRGSDIEMESHWQF